MKRNNKIRTTGLLTYGLFFMGLCLVMLSVLGSEVLKWPLVFNAFIRDIGLLISAVMAGTILHEKLLRDEMLEDITTNLDEKLRERIPDTLKNADLIADKVHNLFSETPPALKGINLINDTRRNFARYYTWVIEQKAQDLFFAGRSVLHRIDADIRLRTGGSMEEIILRKLKEGSRIHILFIDPRCNIIERLALEEGQAAKRLLGDIAKSIGICKRIFNLLDANYLQIPQNAELSIKVYDKIPYFAYHKQDDEVIIGFYFLTGLGCTSAAYEVLDKRTKDHFGDHFVPIFLEAEIIVDFDGARGRPSFNEELFIEMCKVLEEKIGGEKLEELVSLNHQS
jgi:hypothetical protein